MSTLQAKYSKKTVSTTIASMFLLSFLASSCVAAEPPAPVAEDNSTLSKSQEPSAQDSHLSGAQEPEGLPQEPEGRPEEPQGHGEPEAPKDN